MDAVLRIEARITHWARAIASIGFLGLLLIAAATAADVILRKVANTPILGLDDVQEMVGVIGIASCLPLVIAERGSISFRFLGTTLGKRTALWLDAFGAGLFLVFVTLIGWQLILYTADIMNSGRATWELLIPVAPSWMLATALVLLCIPVQLVAFVLDSVRALDFVHAVPSLPPIALSEHAQGEGKL